MRDYVDHQISRQWKLGQKKILKFTKSNNNDFDLVTQSFDSNLFYGLPTQVDKLIRGNLDNSRVKKLFRERTPENKATQEMRLFYILRSCSRF